MRTPTLMQVVHTNIKAHCSMHHGIEGNEEYLVAISSLDDNFIFEKEYKVIGDPLAQTGNMKLWAV